VSVERLLALKHTTAEQTSDRVLLRRYELCSDAILTIIAWERLHVCILGYPCTRKVQGRVFERNVENPAFLPFLNINQ
jgi:hypothetical protein